MFEFLESLAEASQIKIIKELMLFDFLRSDNTGNFPSFLQRDYDGSFRDLCFGFLKRGENIKKFLPRFQGLAPKQIYKKIHFEKFSFKIHDFLSNKTIGSKEMVVIFDYSLKSKVTGLYDYSYIDFKEDFHEQE